MFKHFKLRFSRKIQIDVLLGEISHLSVFRDEILDICLCDWRNCLSTVFTGAHDIKFSNFTFDIQVFFEDLSISWCYAHFKESRDSRYARCQCSLLKQISILWKVCYWYVRSQQHCNEQVKQMQLILCQEHVGNKPTSLIKVFTGETQSWHMKIFDCSLVKTNVIIGKRWISSHLKRKKNMIRCNSESSKSQL